VEQFIKGIKFKKFSSLKTDAFFMKVTMRETTAADAELMARIGRETFDETWNSYYKPEVLNKFLQQNYSVEQIAKDLSDPLFLHFIAFVGEEAAGFVKLSRQQTLGDWINDRCIEICRIYVYKKFHDQKIGKLLMEKSIEVAEKENMDTVVLGVWENNHRAVNFYRRFGFEPIGSHIFYVAEQADTDLVMRKILKASEENTNESN
jgi:ribosomal protein S18 acetylase RimI-like enzyme